MITNQQTNTVYFSNTLPEDFPNEFEKLSRIITEAGYQVKLLVGADDYHQGNTCSLTKESWD